MIHDIAIHNLFKESPTRFRRDDPHLSQLNSLPLPYTHYWWQHREAAPGIFLLFGGRQTGKSTSLKALISHLLQEVQPTNIAYLPCDLMRDRFELVENIRHHISDRDSQAPFWLMLDELTYVKDWEVSIKALADEGLFRQNICIITGSDQMLLDKARRGLVGRRGPASRVDYRVEPLSFAEFAAFYPDQPSVEASFGVYLCCGCVPPCDQRRLPGHARGGDPPRLRRLDRR